MLHAKVSWAYIAEVIASSYSVAGKVVRASLPVWSLVSVFVLSCLSPIYFLCLFVCFDGSEVSHMINGRKSGMINDDLITSAGEKSSTMRNHPHWEKMCLKSLQAYIKHSESASCIRFLWLIWYMVESEATFHCVASLSLGNPLRANGNLHVYCSFKINYSRDTYFWEHLSGWKKYTAMKSDDWKVKGINTLRWKSFFIKKIKKILVQLSSVLADILC